MFTIEEFAEKVNEIHETLPVGVLGEISVKLSDIKDAYGDMYLTLEESTKENEDLKNKLEELRRYNRELFLSKGGKDSDSETEIEEVQIEDDVNIKDFRDFIDEKGRLK